MNEFRKSIENPQQKQKPSEPTTNASTIIYKIWKQFQNKRTLKAGK